MSKKMTVVYESMALVVALISFFPILEYTGYCSSKSTYLTRQQTIGAGLEYISRNITPYVRLFENGKEKDYPTIGLPHYDEIVYGYSEAKNTVWEDSEGLRSPTFFEEITGQYKDAVGVKYTVEYKHNGKVETKQFKKAAIVSNCGHASY